MAERSGVRAVEIEVYVVERDYRPWDDPRLVLDTARSGIAECVQAIASRLSS